METYNNLEIIVHSYRDSTKKIKRIRDFRKKHGFDFNSTSCEIYTDDRIHPFSTNSTSLKINDGVLGISSWNKELSMILQSLILYIPGFNGKTIEIYSSEKMFTKFLKRVDNLIKFIKTEDFKLLYKENSINDIRDIICYEEFIFDKRNKSFDIVYHHLDKLIPVIFSNHNRFIVKGFVYQPFKKHEHDEIWNRHWRHATELRNRVVSTNQILSNMDGYDTSAEIKLRRQIKST